MQQTKDSIRKHALEHLVKKGAKGLAVDEVQKISNGWQAIIRTKKKGMLLGEIIFDDHGKFVNFRPLPA